MFQKEFEVLVVDDDPDVLAVTRLAMRGIKVYGIPFDHIKNVELTNFSATQPKDFNVQRLIRDQGYQDVSGPIRFVGRIDANCPTLIDGQIPGHNPRMTRYDKRSVVVETEVQDTPEFRSWLNNISGELEVLAPESLRKAIDAFAGGRDVRNGRVTLTIDQVVREARHLLEQGFRNILLVAGEHPRFVSEGYLEDCIRALRDLVPTIGIEVGPMEAPEYERMVKAGAEGLVVYHETYDRVVYEQMHTAGPKKDFDWRLACPERGYEGGFRRIGIGALFGLSDWRLEALRLAAALEQGSERDLGLHAGEVRTEAAVGASSELQMVRSVGAVDAQFGGVVAPARRIVVGGADPDVDDIAGLDGDGATGYVEGRRFERDPADELVRTVEPEQLQHGPRHE